MENPVNDKEMEVLFDRFMRTFVENRDPRIDLETNILKQLKGVYLEKARTAILARLEESPGSDAIWSAKAINLMEAIPIMERWIGEIRTNPDSKYRHPYNRGQLAYTLYEFTKDESYIPDLVDVVKNEGYGEFTIGVGCLGRMPLTKEGISAVWDKYKKGKAIKEPHSWRENCAWFLREKIKEPLGQRFLSELPDEEKKELLELIRESGHQRLERKFRLEKYIYGRERYNKEGVNRFDEYIKIGGSPVKGMTLKHLWKGHTGSLHSLAWSSDGQYLASTPSSGFQADAIRIWNFESGKCVKELDPVKEDRYDRHEPKRIAWVLTDENKLAVAYDYSTLTKRGNRVSVWDVEAGKLAPALFEAAEKTYINDLLNFPDGSVLLLNVSNTLFLVNVITQNKERILEGYSGRFETMSVSLDGRLIAVGYYELKDPNTGIEYQPDLYGEGVPHEVLFYDVGNKRVVNRFNTDHIQGVNKLCWMPNQPVLAIASSDNAISVWDLHENKRIALLESEGFVGRISGLAFSANGALLASTSDNDKLLRIWRTDIWDEVMALRELGGYGPAFSFHPSLPILASVCSLREANDNSSGDSPMAIRIWEFDYDTFLANPPFMEEFDKREADIRSKLLREEITEDLEYIKVGGSPTRGTQLRQILKGHTKSIQHIAWSSDGRFLASPSDDKTVRIWDEVRGGCISTLEEQDEMKHSAWSPDNQNLVYGGNKQIKLWNANYRDTSDLLQGDFLRLDSLAFSPDGKMLALAYGYNTIQILETATWKEVSKKIFDLRSNCRISLQWSDDSRQIVASPYMGLIQVLDAQTLDLAREIAVPGDHKETIVFTYAKFGNKVAVAEEKRPILIFDLISGQLEKEFSDITSYTSGLCFSPAGNVLISWCHDNSVYFWRTDTGQKLSRIHEYTLRMIEPVYPIFHPTKPSLITFCDKRRSMRVWDIDYKELLG